MRGMCRPACALLVVVVGCGQRAGTAAAPPVRDATAAASPTADAAPAPTGPWPSRWNASAIGARVAELRAAASLGCLLDSGEDYLDAVERALARDAPVEVTRIAAFAVVERARPDGPSPLAAALSDAVDQLAEVDDVDGLRQAFAETDRLTVKLRWSRNGAAYRARVGLAVPAVERGRALLVVARETALGGDVPAAAAIYDHELGPYATSSPYALPPQVGALVALGRADAARAVIAHAPAEARLTLAATWLGVAVRARTGLDVAIEVVRAEDGRRAPTAPLPEELWAALRAARRAGLAAELGPLRDQLLTHVAAVDDAAAPDIARELFEDAILRGDGALRARLEPAVPPEVRVELHALHELPLDAALAWTRGRGMPPETFARLWARHIVEGAAPAFEAALAAAVCTTLGPPPPPLPPLPGATLTATVTRPADLRACKGSAVTLVLAGADHAPLDDEALDNTCTGRTFAGMRPGPVQHAGGRDALVLHERYLDDGTPRDRFRLAVERCGEIFVSQPFAAPYYTTAFTLAELSVVVPPGGAEVQVVAHAASWDGVVYRLHVPAACNEFPLEEILSDGS